MAVRNGDGDEKSEYHTVGVDAAALQQYAQVRVQDDEVVIYDQDNENAWVQSASTVDPDAMA